MDTDRLNRFNKSIPMDTSYPKESSMTAAEMFIEFQDAMVLEAAQVYAQVTNPAIFTRYSERHFGERIKLLRDYQSYGTLLVNNLSAKTCEMLFPMDSSFFKIEKTPEIQEILQQLPTNAAKYADSYLSRLEMEASSRVFLNGGYSELSRAIQLCIVTGNALLYRDSINKNFITYDLNNYAVYRDGKGKVRYIIIKERSSYIEFTDKQLEEANITLAGTKSLKEVLWIYTVIQRIPVVHEITMDDGSTEKVTRYGYNVWQELNGTILEGSLGYYPENRCPYIPLTWKRMSTEHYGRGHVEDYISDLSRYSELSFKTFEYSAAMLKFLLMVPAGVIDSEDLMEKENGEYVTVGNSQGSPSQSLEGGEYNKLQQIQNDMMNIELRLAKGFMYNGVVRNSERTTAEEIRAQMREAEFTLGQAYTNISTELHPRLASVLVSEIDSDLEELLDEGGLKLDVAVGLASLNRSAIVTRLQYAANAISLIIPVFQQTSQRFNIESVIDSILDGFGIDKNTVQFSEEEMKQRIEQQQAEMQQQAQQIQQASQPNPKTTEINAAQLGLQP